MTPIPTREQAIAAFEISERKCEELRKELDALNLWSDARTKVLEELANVTSERDSIHSILQRKDALIAEQISSSATIMQERDKLRGEYEASVTGYEAACDILTEARDAALSRVRELEEGLTRLITSASLLQQNSEGCATNHHGHDCEIHGLPGWLRDTQIDIESARALLDGKGPNK